MADTRATTGLPAQNGSARPPATFAAPGPPPVDEGRCAPEASVAVGHVDRGRFAAGEHLVDTGGFESDPEAIVPAGHQEEVLDSESLHLLGDRGRRLEVTVPSAMPAGLATGVVERRQE